MYRCLWCTHTVVMPTRRRSALNPWKSGLTACSWAELSCSHFSSRPPSFTLESRDVVVLSQGLSKRLSTETLSFTARHNMKSSRILNQFSLRLFNITWRFLCLIHCWELTFCTGNTQVVHFKCGEGARNALLTSVTWWREKLLFDQNDCALSFYPHNSQMKVNI